MAAVTDTIERQLVLPGWAVKAVMAGHKRAIRRYVHPTPTRVADGVPKVVRKWRGRDVMGDIACPFGAAGDRLWVKEAAWLLEEPFADVVIHHDGGGRDAHAEIGPVTWVLSGGPGNVAYQADMANPPPVPVEGQRWKRTAALHLPRCYSRLTLEIVAVRCHRLHDISDGEAALEYAPPDIVALRRPWLETFATSWEVTHGDGTWDTNPWVWAIRFEVAK